MAVHPVKFIWIKWLIFVIFFGSVLGVIYQESVQNLIIMVMNVCISGICSELFILYGSEWMGRMRDVKEAMLCAILSKTLWTAMLRLESMLVKMSRKRKETMERQIHENSLIQHYNRIICQDQKEQEWWEELRQFRHDIKQYYLIERALLEAKDYEALEQFCNRFLIFLDKHNVVSDTGNIHLDSIINYKADMAEKWDINFLTDLCVPQDADICAEDLSVCLGNLLDNAIEAEKGLTDNKQIDVVVRADGKNLFINVKNNYNSVIHKTGKRYLTSKENKKDHGLGLMIVRQVVEKYDGDFHVNDANGKFDVTILLYDFIK